MSNFVTLVFYSVYMEQNLGFYLQELEMEGFASYLSPVSIDFSDMSQLAIIGDNGAGKSTLLDGILFALFGQTRLKGLDLAISLKASQAQVRLTFKVGEDRWRVKRVRAKNKSLLLLEKEEEGEWVDHSAMTVRETQETLESLIGVEFDTLIATCFLRQGEADRFAASSPAEKREFLADILHLGDFDTLASLARKQEAELRQQKISVDSKIELLGGVQSQIEALQEQIANTESRIEVLTQDVKDLEVELEAGRNLAQRSEQRQQLLRNKASLERSIQQLQSANTQATNTYINTLANLDNEITELEGRTATVVEDPSPKVAELKDVRNQTQATKDALQKEIQELDKALSTYPSRFQKGENEITLMTTKIWELENLTCASCKQPLPKTDSIEQELAESKKKLEQFIAFKTTLESRQEQEESQRQEKAQQVVEIESSLRGLSDQLDQLNTQLVQFNNYQNTFQRLQKVQSQKDNLTPPVLTDTSDMEGQLQQLTKEITALPEEVIVDLSQIEGRLNSARAQVNAATNQLTKDSTALDRAVQDLAQLQDLQEQIQVIEKNRQIYQTLVESASKSGVQSFLLSQILPELEQLVNDYLQKITQGEIFISFVTEREGKNGEISTLEILVKTIDGERPYGTFSGAERFIMDMALRIGLSRLLTTSNGKTMRFLAIDEGWGSLDPTNVTRLLDVLKTISSDFDLIMTITHIEDVASVFPDRIRIEKTSHGSRILSA